ESGRWPGRSGVAPSGTWYQVGGPEPPSERTSIRSHSRVGQPSSRVSILRIWSAGRLTAEYQRCPARNVGRRLASSRENAAASMGSFYPVASVSSNQRNSYGGSVTKYGSSPMGGNETRPSS